MTSKHLSQDYPWIRVFDIYILLIIYGIKKLNIYKLSIDFWISIMYYYIIKNKIVNISHSVCVFYVNIEICTYYIILKI